VNRSRFVIGTAAALGAAAYAPARADVPVSLTFPATGGSLAYRRYGTGGPIDVFLAGGPGMRATYLDPVAQTLAVGRTAIVFDQRGTGDSRAAFGDGSLVSVAGDVADVDALRVTLGLQKLGLVGHSWGAMLSMAYAAAHPDRVAYLALLDPGGPNMRFSADFLSRVGAHMTDDEKMAAATAMDAGKLPPPSDVVPAYFHDHAKGVAFARTPEGSTVYSDVYAAIGRDAADHYDVTTALKGTTLATLALYGSDDPSLAAKSALDALFPHATVTMIPNAGHFPWLENPVPFYAAVTAFQTSAPVPA
jgi:pimeloyl-ACP methyl ester carboxylesterase